LRDSIAFVEDSTLRISTSQSRNDVNCSHAERQSPDVAGHLPAHVVSNSSNAAHGAVADGAV
jgi:hypothetical protein